MQWDPQADILHLSDLHFGSLDDARRLHSQLAEDLKRELGCTKLDGMILSGDMTMVCAEDEYAAARSFLDTTAGEFGLAGERIVLVPGNHDLSWPRSKAAYKPRKRTDYLSSTSGTASMLYLSRGATRTRINLEVVREAPMPLPPRHEQGEIVKHCTAVRTKIDCLSAAVDQQLTRLQEYRQALITAAVTGQLDIEQAA